MVQHSRLRYILLHCTIILDKMMYKILMGRSITMGTLLTNRFFCLFSIIAIAFFISAGCNQNKNKPKEPSSTTEKTSNTEINPEVNGATEQKTANTIYKNGKIYTVNDQQPWAESIAIKDGKFIAVGSNDDVNKLAGTGTEIIDLEGKFVMPGIFDLHVHPFATPLFNMINLDFSDPTDPDKMLSELKEFADANPDKKWIRAGSWGVGVFPNNSPTKEMLDEIIPDRPVVLIDQTGHAYWLNSKALELANITSDTPTDELYIIDKDPKTGEPSGTIRESTMRMVEQVAEQPSLEEYYKAFSDVFHEYNQEGVTSMQTAEGNTAWLDVVQAMENKGDLTMRLYIGWDWHLHLTTPYTNDEMDEQILNRSKYASDMVKPDFVKIFTDGTPDGYAVPFLEPYSDGSGKYGKGKLSPEELKEIVIGFDKEGVGVFMHAIGDASVRAALDAIEAARKTNGDTGVRHKVAHTMLVHPDDLPRFSSIPGVAVEISPAVTYPLPAFEGYIPLIGEERYNRIYAAGSLMKSGARVGYGSDWLTMIPPSPWMPMQGFVTRTNPKMPEKGELGKNETLSVEQVIKVFTLNGAYAVGVDDKLGSIEVGKLADMIVLDHNLFQIKPTDIRNTQVLRTVLGGKVVYERAKDKELNIIDEEDYEKSRRIVH